MMRNRLTKFNHWIAILALVFMALAPVISKVYASESQTSSDVICSTTGIKVINVDDQNGNVNSMLGDHCSYCSFGTDKLFLDAPKANKLSHETFTNLFSNTYSPNRYNSLSHLGFNSQAPPVINL
jgi:hypothetical protein